MDATGLMGPLPEGSFFALLAEHGDRIVRDEDFAECYSERMGRPSIPPSLLAKVLLLQYRCGLSDEQAMQRWRGICAGRIARVPRGLGWRGEPRAATTSCLHPAALTR